ncbi:MAG: M20/M25/M40 family metallo-hydrolase [Planctomycetota bacterium]|nr:MAG: M20/M25/M40 family metallo-hydrolase [Planctomycetota bacterium]
MLALLLLSLPQESPAPTAAELQAHVKLLSSDDLEGRRAGTAGADQAAWYLAGAMAAAGLQPAGENGTWFQSFEVQLEPQAGDCKVVFLTGVEKAWEDVGTLACSASKTVEGALVSAEYGLVLPSHDLDDFGKAGVEGQIALVRRYTPFGPQAGGELGKLGNLRDKIRAAAKAGAKAVILGTHPSDVAQGGEGELAFDAVKGTMPIPVLTVDPTRFQRLEDAVQNGEAWVKRMLLQAEVLQPTAKTLNVLGLLPGEGDEYVVAGGHYDHLGWGGQGSLAPGVHAIHNGADDNASGAAVLLEVAEAMAQPQLLGPKRKRNLVFAFWGAEEMGLIGSKYWVEHPTVPLSKVVCNVNLDMVGRLQDGHITVGAQESAEAFVPALEKAQQEASFLGLPDQAQLEFRMVEGRLPGGGGSDHMSFHAEEIAAVFFFSGLHSDYHKPSDDWPKLDYPRMATFCQQIHRFLNILAGELPREDLAYQAPAQEDPPASGTREVKGARAWFGSIPDYGAQPEGGGMQLAGTSPGGPAAKAGLQKGDILRHVGEVEIHDIYDFMDAMAKYSPGDQVKVRFLRKGAWQEVLLTLASRGGS